MRRVSLYRALVVAVFALTAMTFAGAQQQTAQLNGQVMDVSGAAVPGATVTVTNPGRGISVKVISNENGDYVVPLLPPDDHYTVTVTKTGFKETVQREVSLQVAQSAKIDLTMDVGAIAQTVTVSSAPPLLDTQTSSLGQVITGHTVEALPLNGRSSFRLIALTPGVTFSRSAYGQFGDVAVNSTWDTNFSINGGRAQSNEILIDGVPSSTGFFNQITTLPSVDDTQEFKVESNNLSAAYGRYSGGAINVSTKSGTNTYHGNVFEFLRNSAFDANDWFNKQKGQPIPPFRMNQFGATIGGPLTIPHLYHGADRTFFFLDYQGTRRTKGSTFIGTVPTDLEKQGDFSQTADIYDPFSTDATTKQRTQFDGNKIPAGRMDPVALKIMAYYPKPNLPGNINNYISNAPVQVLQDIGSVRIDQNVTQRYHLSGRYAYSRTTLTQPNVFGNIADGPGAVGTTYFKNQSFALDNTYIFTPSLLLTVNYGFARWYQSRQTLSYGFDNGTLGFPGSLVSAISIPMFPAINIGGYSGLANQSFLNNGNDSHAVLVSLTKIAGRHNVVVGVDGRMHRINFFNVSNSGGSYSFAIAQTQGPTATTANGTGDAFASFLLGVGSSGSMPLGSGQAIQDFYGAVYAQDNFRFNERLTLNLGVRYDGESPYLDRHNELNYFDPTLPSPAANPSFPNLKGGLVFAGVNGHSRNVYSRQHNNVVPRFGFSYSAANNIVVRGGFGMSYAPLEMSSNAVGFIPNLGYSSATSWNTSSDGGLTPANLLSDPFPQGLVQPAGNSLGAATQLGQSITVWNHDPKTPVAYQWNLDVQQQFPAAILFDLGYAGSRGDHLSTIFQLNQLDPKYDASMGKALSTQVANPFQHLISIGALSNAKVSQQQLLLPYPQFLGVTEVNNPAGSSIYHSMQVKLVKRETHGVSMLAAYTWSKLISDVNAQNAPIGATDTTVAQNYYNLAAERSVSELDIPHSLVVNSVVHIPVGHGQKFFGNVGTLTDKLIGGWKVTGIFMAQSGFPLTITTSATGGANRVNPVAGQNPAIHGNRSNQDRVTEWFNTAAFATPAAYTFGTVRRTITSPRGPGVVNLDTSVMKDMMFFDRLNTEFRAEFFNVTNTPHFGMPNMNRQAAAFGTITSVISSPPQRQIQFALKVSF